MQHTSLHCAQYSQVAHFHILEFLLECNPDVNCPDEYGTTPIHLAMALMGIILQHEEREILQQATITNILQRILSMSKDVNCVDCYGDTRNYPFICT